MALSGVFGSAVGGVALPLRPPAESVARTRTATAASAPAIGGVLIARVGAAGLQSLADRHLAGAIQAAGADVARWSSYGQGLQAAQALVGDLPAQAQTAAVAVARSADPASDGSLGQLEAVAGAGREAAGQLGAISQAADTDIQARIASANDLLGQLAGLNREISAAWLSGEDSSAAQGAQGALADQLASLLGTTATRRSDGGLEIRAADGARLAGDTATTLGYAANAGGQGQVSAAAPDAAAPARAVSLDSGEVRGLLDLRNQKLPQITAQLFHLAQVAGQALSPGPGRAEAAANLFELAHNFQTGLGWEAAQARSGAEAATAVAAEAESRRQGLAALNPDQELANLATYQRATSAATQMSDGAKDLSQALLAAA